MQWFQWFIHCIAIPEPVVPAAEEAAPVKEATVPDTSEPSAAAGVPQTMSLCMAMCCHGPLLNISHRFRFVPVKSCADIFCTIWRSVIHILYLKHPMVHEKEELNAYDVTYSKAFQKFFCDDFG